MYPCTLPSRSYPLAPRGVGVSCVRRSPPLFYTLHPGHSHLNATTVRKSRPATRPPSEPYAIKYGVVTTEMHDGVFPRRKTKRECRGRGLEIERLRACMSRQRLCLCGLRCRRSVFPHIQRASEFMTLRYTLHKVGTNGAPVTPSQVPTHTRGQRQHTLTARAGSPSSLSGGRAGPC